jgi:hypothetical protein
MKNRIMRAKTNFNTSFFNRQVEDAIENNLKGLDKLHPEMLEERKRLKEIFDLIDEGNEKVQIIACPSISLKREDIEKIVAIDLYEMRSLWQILYAVKKNIHVLYLSSNPVETENVKHLLKCVGLDKEVRSRISFYDLADFGGLNLSEKVINSGKFLNILEKQIEKFPTFLMPFNYTDIERRLAGMLGIPVFGCHPTLNYWQTKSGNKTIFRRADIPMPEGVENIKTREDIMFGVMNLWRQFPEQMKYMVKLDSGVSGEGNALLTLDMEFVKFDQLSIKEKLDYIEARLMDMRFQQKDLDFPEFAERMEIGGIIEIFLEGEDFYSPSSQGYIHPNLNVELLATHEQVLDESGMKFLGCRFPAPIDIRTKIANWTKQIGAELSQIGVIGFFSVDYIVYKNEKGVEEIKVIEINIRQGGTTHPYQTAKLVTNAKFNDSKGILESSNGNPVHYFANDNFCLENLKATAPKNLIGHLEKKNVLFNPSTQKGAVLHMLNSMSRFGKIGYTIIGSSNDEVDGMRLELEKVVNEYASGLAKA